MPFIRHKHLFKSLFSGNDLVFKYTLYSKRFTFSVCKYTYVTKANFLKNFVFGI